MFGRSVPTGNSRALKGHAEVVYSVTYHPDGRELASGSFDNTIRLWNVKTGGLLKELRGHTHWVMSVTYRSDGRELASGSDDNTIRLWNVETGSLCIPATFEHRFRKHSNTDSGNIRTPIPDAFEH